MRRKIALFLAVLMSVSAITGCGQEKETTSTETTTTKESTTTITTEGSEVEEVRENITIDVLSFGNPTFQDNFNNYVVNSPVYEELVNQTGVELNIYGLANDQVNVRISGGDLGDLIQTKNADQYTAMFESDQLLPLNDLIEEYLPTFQEDFPGAWEWMVQNGDKDGNVYILSIGNGKAGVTANTGRYLYTLRWDLYKQLGYPEIVNEDDFLEVAKAMQELEPTTPEGKTTYGVSFSLRDNMYYNLVSHWAATQGWTNKKDHYIFENVPSGDIVYDFADENGMLWGAAKFYNKAYRMGILDPDCFTQTDDDYDARVATGEILTCWSTGQMAGYNDKQDGSKGFVLIPVDGTMFYQNSTSPKGYSFSYGICIPKDCKDPERVMEFLAYCFSKDGTRLLLSGVEGIHWDYNAAGEPVYNEETYKILTTGTADEIAATGINQSCLLYIRGWNGGEICDDGYTVNLKIGTDYFSRMTMPEFKQDYCEYYGATSEADLLTTREAEGKMWDLSYDSCTASIPTATEDIARIDSLCMGIALEAIPKLVMASSDDEFEKIKAEVMAEMKAAGAEEAEKYYKDGWNAQR